MLNRNVMIMTYTYVHYKYKYFNSKYFIVKLLFKPVEHHQVWKQYIMLRVSHLVGVNLGVKGITLVLGANHPHELL
jgi:hypothetical protein